jgi:hypothetical protein
LQLARRRPISRWEHPPSPFATAAGPVARSREAEFGDAHVIIVTPFIDVALAPLVIFMAAAPQTHARGADEGRAGRCPVALHDRSTWPCRGPRESNAAWPMPCAMRKSWRSSAAPLPALPLEIVGQQPEPVVPIQFRLR